MFFFLTGISCFWNRFLQPFLDLKISKDCTHVCNLLNLSDRQKVINETFKNTKYYNKSENLHATLDSQLPIVLGFLPPEGVPGRSWQLLAAPGSSWQFLAAPGSPWQPLAATKLIFCMIFGPGGRKIVITRRSGQLQSSYFACADLWTCWIRFWYSRSPKLTKMICCWRFSFLYFSYFPFIYILGSAAWGFSL